MWFIYTILEKRDVSTCFYFPDSGAVDHTNQIRLLNNDPETKELSAIAFCRSTSYQFVLMFFIV